MSLISLNISPNFRSYPRVNINSPHKTLQLTIPKNNHKNVTKSGLVMMSFKFFKVKRFLRPPEGRQGIRVGGGGEGVDIWSRRYWRGNVGECWGFREVVCLSKVKSARKFYYWKSNVGMTNK